MLHDCFLVDLCINKDILVEEDWQTLQLRNDATQVLKLLEGNPCNQLGSS